jgi:hypothetical protein
MTDFFELACSLSRREARKCREQAERRILAILGANDSPQKRETLEAVLAEHERLQDQLDALPIAESDEEKGRIS